MTSILYKNARIIDGSGAPWFNSDLAVEDGKIVSISKNISATADRVIELDGEVISPGFIDMHSHSDLSLLANGRAESKIRQGVTTEITGNCGSSPAPIFENGRQEMIKDLKERYELDLTWSSFAEYLKELDDKPVSVNVLPLVGHTALRRAVMGTEDRKPTSEEMQEMQDLLKKALRAGAAGFSSGLIYPPSSYADTEELIGLARTAAKFDAFYATHMRQEGAKLPEGVREAIEVGEKSGIPVQISHHKVANRESWGLVSGSLNMLEKARKRGVDITFDVYPYQATATGLSALLPDRVHEGGREKLKQRLNNEETRRKIESELAEKGRRRGWNNILISSTNIQEFKKLEGKSIEQAAAILKMKPAEAVINILAREKARVGMIGFAMCEEDVKEVLAHRLGMVGSDGSASADYGVLRHGKPHPRSFGTFPRVLGKYVREENIMTLERALHKMTGLPAWRLGFQDRGLIREGFAADLVVFRPEEIGDRANFEDPYQYPSGIRQVLVNGEIVIENGEHTDRRPGKRLSR